MRPSPQRHTLAVFRTLVGLTQKEMAELAGCSRPTIQAIELGKLPLSVGLAERIREQTHIDLGWLLGKDLTLPPIATTGEPYTKALLEDVQSKIKNPTVAAADITEINEIFVGLVHCLASTLISAYAKKKLALCYYRLKTYNQHLFQEFGEWEPFNTDSRKPKHPGFDGIRVSFLTQVATICDKALVASAGKAKTAAPQSKNIPTPTSPSKTARPSSKRKPPHARKK